MPSQNILPAVCVCLVFSIFQPPGLAAEGKSFKRLEKLVKSQKTALAYVFAINDNGLLSIDEKEIFLKKNQDSIASMKSRLSPVMFVLNSDIGFDEVLRKSLNSTSISVLSGVPSTTRYHYPVGITFRVISKDGIEPRLIRTEKRTVRYLAGRKTVNNPKKSECERIVAQSRQLYLDTVRDQERAQQQYEDCQRNRAFNKYLICVPPVLNQIGVAVVENKYRETEDWCNTVPSTLEADDYRDAEYDREYWAINPSIVVEATAIDTAHKNRTILTKTLSFQYRVEGEQVRGNPRYNLADKPLSLPSQAAIDKALMAGLESQTRTLVGETFQSLVAGIEEDIAKASGIGQLEMMARYLILTETLGITIPDRESIISEITTRPWN